MAQPRNEATRQNTPGDSKTTETSALEATTQSQSSVGVSGTCEVQQGTTDCAVDDQLERIAQLLCFAPWEEIWQQVSRQEVAGVLPKLDLPEGVRRAWGRWLETTASRSTER